MKIEIPTNCPCCSYPLTLVTLQLFCKNPSCSAQIAKKLEHFTKVLGIKGFGPATIHKLDLADITEIFYLDRDTLVDSLGSEKVADKLLSEIDRARSADLATVLASFSIPLLGETAAKKLASVVNDISEVNQETCKLAGLGDKVTANLLDWISSEYQELKEFLPFSFKSEKSRTKANGKTVCITGKLTSFKTKSEATTKLTEAGYVVVESVTKTTTYLVDEQNNGSSKRLKADKYGVIIIDNLNNFLKESKTHE